MRSLESFIIERSLNIHTSAEAMLFDFWVLYVTRILLSIIMWVHVTILSIPGAGSIIAAGWLPSTCNGSSVLWQRQPLISVQAHDNIAINLCEQDWSQKGYGVCTVVYNTPCVYTHMYRRIYQDLYIPIYTLYTVLHKFCTVSCSRVYAVQCAHAAIPASAADPPPPTLPSDPPIDSRRRSRSVAAAF